MAPCAARKATVDLTAQPTRETAAEANAKKRATKAKVAKAKGAKEARTQATGAVDTPQTGLPSPCREKQRAQKKSLQFHLKFTSHQQT